jgi:HEAT repeat protein
MACEKESRSGGGDCLEGVAGDRPFDFSATAWLIGQAVRYLNTADKEGELAYQRVTELLRDRKDVVESLIGMLRHGATGDAPLRWSFLYVLGDVADRAAAEFLAHAALEPLPENKPDEGCEGTRDTEMLVRTMAVHALRRVAERHPEAGEHLLKIVSKRPDRPILIEAVKAAGDLGFKEKILEILPKEDHWILDIRRARTEEIFAEPEREEGKERGFTPPKMGSQYTAPHVVCCERKED